MRNRSEASLVGKAAGSECRVSGGKETDTVAELKKVLEKLGTQEEVIEKLSRQVEKLAERNLP